MQCPANSKRRDLGAGCKSPAENLLLLNELQMVSIAITVEQLIDGSGIENTLLKNKASWHKSCKDNINSTKLKRAQKRREQEEDATSHSPMKTRTSLADEGRLNENESKCFFGKGVAGPSGLHKASTFEIDRSVRESAIKLKDTDLLVKLIGGDMVAIEAKCHVKCLVALYNQVQKLQRPSADEDSNETSLHGIAFASLKEFHDCEDVAVFKLVELAKLYSAKLKEHGITTSPSKINTIGLKERPLGAFPDLSAHTQGRDVLLILNNDNGDAITKACDQDFDCVEIFKK